MSLTFLNNSSLRMWFSRAYLLIFFAIIVLRQASDYLIGGSAYQTADWLINYSGGFVRRGLFGELFLALPFSAPVGIWVLFSIQSVLYGGVLVFGYFMMRRNEYSWLSILIWCGPATLGFFAWDSGSPFRKEILGYLVIVCLVAIRGQHKRKAQNLLIIIALLSFGLAVFSWEANVLFLPLITFMIWTNPNMIAELGRRITFVLLFFALGISGAIASILNHGTAQTASDICQSVRERGYEATNLCSGAIEAIGWSSSHPLNLVSSSFPLYLGYLFFFPLALAPMLVALRGAKLNFWAVTITCSILPLFIVVNDYGRWINMIAMSLAFMTTTLNTQPIIKFRLLPLVSLVYLTAWGLPHWLDPLIGNWPWLGFLETVLDLLQRIL